MTLLKVASVVAAFFTFIGLALAGNTYTTIDFPGATDTWATGVNKKGDLVGYYYVAPDTTLHGFLLSGGTFMTIDVPGAATQIFGINDDGLIIGRYNFPGDHFHGFVFDGFTFTNIDFPGASDTGAYAINNKGQIVGFYGDANHSHAFVLTHDDYKTIDPPGRWKGVAATGINDSGSIVGWNLSEHNLYWGFRYSNGVFQAIRVPGQLSSFGGSVNDDGVVVGTFFSFVSEYCYTLVDGRFHHLAYPGAFTTSCSMISDSAQIVGFWQDFQSKGHGFLISTRNR